MSKHGKRAPGEVLVQFQTQEHTKAALQQLAKSDRRSLSSYLRLWAERLTNSAEAVSLVALEPTKAPKKRRPINTVADQEEAREAKRA